MLARSIPRTGMAQIVLAFSLIYIVRQDNLCHLLPVRGIRLDLITALLFVSHSLSLPNHPGHAHGYKHSTTKVTTRAEICLNPAAPGFAFTDYSVKVREQTCVAPKLENLLVSRDIVADDYSCSESKPCKNGACCAKSGYCGMPSLSSPAVQL